jgi:hypothetical protein
MVSQKKNQEKIIQNNFRIEDYFRYFMAKRGMIGYIFEAIPRIFGTVP